ncbi:MAG: alanine--glyoxylate aminotransferase family protein [Halobacteriales archaeon]
MPDPGDRLLMTPGPTELPPDVREAMSRPIVNPDVEPAFGDYYETLLSKLATVYGTDDDVLVLGGEGILGLEAAVASLVDPGDEVLVLANGIYGHGFADFVENYGGDPTVHDVPDREGFDVDAVKELVATSDFEVATAVHCETPTGVLNDLGEILPILQDAGVLTVVDAVSSLGGTAVPIEHVDVALGASQKCLSSPPGLTTTTVSDDAWAAVEATDREPLYTGLAPWHDVDPAAGDPTPYTHLISNLYALEASLDRILEEGLDAVYERHERAARRTRERGRELGLDVYPDDVDRSSPTVTAFEMDRSATAVQRAMAEKHGVVVATSLGDLADDVLRIGHMGYGASVERVDRTMDALEAVLAD